MRVRIVVPEAMKPYYEDSAVTIYLGKCEEVLATMLPASVDHVITDPPYARDVYVRLSAPKSKNGSGTPGRLGIRNHQYSSASIEKLAAGDIGCIDEILAEVAVQIARLSRRWALVFSDVETCHRWKFELEQSGMRYVRTGAWVKPDPMPQFSGDRPAVGFEPCTITHAQGPMRWNGGGKAAVWTHGTVKIDRPDHPCPKPLSLMTQLVELFSDRGELIIDPFMGSGTTLRAAKDVGRRAIGIEMDERYCEVAAKRMQQEMLGLTYAPEPETETSELAL